MSDEFVPPNPKEFDKNKLIFLSTAVGLMFSLAENSSGFSKLMLGATKFSFIMIIEYTISLAPAIQHSWPVIDLVELTGTPVSPMAL